MLIVIYHSMFVYLAWKNLDGKELKSMLEYKKAEKMIRLMKDICINPHIIFEPTSVTPKTLLQEK